MSEEFQLKEMKMKKSFRKEKFAKQKKTTSINKLVNKDILKKNQKRELIDPSLIHLHHLHRRRDPKSFHFLRELDENLLVEPFRLRE